MRVRLAILAVVSVGFMAAQGLPPGAVTLQVPGTQAASVSAEAEIKEMNELGQAVSEAGQSLVDRIRALEQHLKKYPESKQRQSIERNLAALAMELNDQERIILYGEKVLAMGGEDDLKMLDRVTFALTEAGNTPARLKRAVEYAKRYEKAEAQWLARGPSGGYTLGQYTEELNRIAARALALHANATGKLGNEEEASQLAMRSWQTFPTGEGASEAGFWLAKLGRNKEAIEYYAEAFTVEDPRKTELDRAHDRARLGALYTALNGSEKGLGDVILSAYDRSTALIGEQRAQLKAKDPNAQASGVFDFTLPGLNGKSLALASLKGKTIILDFWATWCVPCKVQHPMIENVKKKLGDAADLVFLAVTTDEDHSIVAPFLKQTDWETGNVYFHDGLAVKLNIAAIPTVLVIDPAGQVSSRMAGFLPERFEEMLTARIQEARQTAAQK